ncbi:DUF4062 domain-containing protein [Qipengyuania psychrotolerans]|uniref:DUF4062 domain-containing protein n=1 Tax=Qipengyuania psychrotolerans TaxID=2867238 RepID=A0ABX8ZF29_9SPHN|nr:DUF4062 domain-containing protein [Qipengyuania psychrotolerans]QZD86122.1 DUF4062 domain-containing protein [Qipengyuania psychrotolerans]
MRIFISSVISGFEQYRDAVDTAIRSLGHEVIRAEEFPASDAPSRVACLSGVRDADLVVLLLGERYGVALPPADVAPTHEEFLEAKGVKPILVFVQQGVERESAQEAFISVVESWDKGRHRRGFVDAEELRSEVTRAIHQYELSLAKTPVNPDSLFKRAIQMCQIDRGHRGRGFNGQLTIALAGGPEAQILRPRELESEQLEAEISKMLLFAPHSIFDRTLGIKTRKLGGLLHFRQDDGRQFAISEQGDLIITLGIVQANSGIPCVIIEDVEEAVRRCFLLASDVLDLIDSAHKLSRFVIAMRASDLEYAAWRTRAEHAASPNSVTHAAFFAGGEPRPVTLSPADIPRAAIGYDASMMAEDFAALLQREAAGERRGSE